MGVPGTAKTTQRAVAGAENDWVAALRGDREAFQRVVTPHLGTLLDAAMHELRYHNALGDFGGDSPTAEEVVGEVLIRAWRDRKRRPANLSTRAWLIGLLFRVVQDLIRRELRFHAVLAKSTEGPPPPPTSYDDDEGFWEWYQPDEAPHLENELPERTFTPEEVAIADDDFAHALPPRARQALLLHDVHGVPMHEVATVIGTSEGKAWRILSKARRSLGKTLSGQT
jgi:RNA polymerase sigma-70 factor, ECF subfamily